MAANYLDCRCRLPLETLSDLRGEGMDASAVRGKVSAVVAMDENFNPPGIRIGLGATPGNHINLAYTNTGVISLRDQCWCE